jgi:L-aspartate oxidase
VLAQGGVACPIDEDDIESHIQDTLIAGAGMCNEEAARALIRNGYAIVRELIELGVPFDRGKDGKLLFTREAAHSKSRILHIDGDRTGLKLHSFLEKRNHIKRVSGTISDLLIADGVCYGVSALFGGQPMNLYARHTIIASGGFGGLYQVTTSHGAMIGQLHAIAAMRGCRLADMHFTQFHPTALNLENSAPQKPLLSEALRGEGALIEDEDRRGFLADYGENELSPRDKLSRAIFHHQQKGHRVFLNLSRFDEPYFKSRFPAIRALLNDHGYESPYDAVPISPAFHYAMGGIAVDLRAKTLDVQGLYAIGEAACTGAHGANRLASNSLLEALVFGKIAAETIAGDSVHNAPKTFKISSAEQFGADDRACMDKTQKILWEKVGIARAPSKMRQAKEELNELKNMRIGELMKHSLSCAEAIVDQALAMNKSVGAHYVKEESL